VRGCATVSEPVRRRALDLAAHFHEEEVPTRYAAAAQALACRPGLPDLLYRQALKQAEAACTRAPEDGSCLTALGMAQYRVGRHPEALETLLRADRANARPPGGSAPSVLALLALTHHRLGHSDEARTHLGRLRERLKEPGWRPNEEARALISEAALLIEGK
jgi:hypothetical protein